MTGTLTFLGHSGFFLELPEISLLMDWWKGDLPPIPEEKPLLVLVSHGHSDHFNPGVFALAGTGRPVRFLLGRDIRLTPRHRTQWGLTEETADSCLRMGGGETAEPFPGVVVETLPSTDEGVAFLVAAEGQTVFHAGDLNWWHWEGESETFNKMIRRTYQSEINKLRQEKIDAAFVPVDPRLGEQYCWGLDCFMKRTDTEKVFPMHFWGSYEVFDRLLLEKCTREYEDRIMRIEREGQSFLLEK